ncbi:hypothetical protein D3C79_956630 [compost metagenome]
MACFGGEFEFLEDVLSQVGQGKAFQHRLYEAMFQPHQFQQRLRQTADLAALVQGDAQIATAVGRGQRGVLERQGFQITVQRGQRRTQVVGDVCHQFAALLILTGQ